VTAFDDELASLRQSGERIAIALTTIGFRALTDERVVAVSTRVQRELRQARAVGEIAVLMTAARLKPSAPPAAPAPAATTDASAPVPPEPSAIAGYTTLSASQIVPLLTALTDRERSEVLEYERATRQRKTILAALRRQS
jgi:hypothetical protein